MHAVSRSQLRHSVYGISFVEHCDTGSRHSREDHTYAMSYTLIHMQDARQAIAVLGAVNPL